MTTGIFGLPWDFIGSVFITLGSGTPYTINDQSQGAARRPEPHQAQRRPARSVRLHHSRTRGRIAASTCRSRRRSSSATHNAVSVIFQGFNVFSFDNFSGYQGNIPTLPATNPNFGKPSSLVDPGRRLQFGLRYGF